MLQVVLVSIITVGLVSVLVNVGKSSSFSEGEPEKNDSFTWQFSNNFLTTKVM